LNRNNFISALGVTLIAFLALPRPAAAQSGAASQPASNEQAFAFPKGTYTYALYVAQGAQYTASDGNKTREDMSEITTGVAYYFVPDISFGWELTGSYTSQPGPNHDVTAGGGNLQMLGHFLDERTWTLFGDCELGILESNHQIPPNGTDFNFTVHAGAGVTAKLWDNANLIAGARFLHLSNADVHGALRNPSINGGEAYVGLLFKL
jgi:Lipid A 3-O-deacylase (PagL)